MKHITQMDIDDLRENKKLPFKVKEVLTVVKNYKEDTKEECCVCYNDTNSFTKCNHPVCDECLNLIPTYDCPLCRQELELNQSIIFKEKV
jgi:hypothetical protein